MCKIGDGLRSGKLPAVFFSDGTQVRYKAGLMQSEEVRITMPGETTFITIPIHDDRKSARQGAQPNSYVAYMENGQVRIMMKRGLMISPEIYGLK